MNPISEIILGEIIEDEKVLLNRGYIFIDDEKQNMLTNNLSDLIEDYGIGEADLSAITGLTRQNLNMIIQNRIKPSVDFALKVAAIFNKPVEEIFSLSDNAWFDKITGYKDSAIYLQTNINKVIGKSEKDANFKENKAEYYSKETKALMTKEQYQEGLKQYVSEHLDELMKQYEEANPKSTRNERLSFAQQTIREKYASKHPKLYKKIGQPLDPKQMLQAAQEKNLMKKNRKTNN